MIHLVQVSVYALHFALQQRQFLCLHNRWLSVWKFLMSASQARLRSVVLCSDGGALRLSVHEHCRYDVMVHYLRV